MALWPVILGGGCGSRLWPLSRRARPKQFHALASHTSLLADSLARLHLFDRSVQPATVICHAAHADLALAALDETGFSDGSVLLEPEGRNTAAAAVLACLWASRSDTNAVVALMPADHHIARPEKLIKAMSAANLFAQQGRMVVFGIPPDRPDTGYGYIERGTAQQLGFAIARFVEKPDAKTAQRYLASGRYDWNAGIFMLHAARYLDELGRLRPDIASPATDAFRQIGHQGRLGLVPSLPWAKTASDSIDYAYAEHSQNGIVVPVDVGWSDVGSWSALYALETPDSNQNAVHGNAVMVNTRTSYVRSQSRRLIALAGVNDLIVVDTDDAILIARRNGSSDDMRTLNRILGTKNSDLL